MLCGRGFKRNDQYFPPCVFAAAISNMLVRETGNTVGEVSAVFTSCMTAVFVDGKI